MEGSKFRVERERIEDMYEEVGALIEKKDAGKASKKIEKASEMLDELSDINLSEIQERSVFNLQIKQKHLKTNIDKIKK